ncbi:FAD-binding protein [Sphingomonas crocodyli]|uniref:FAD-binding protein n=1 Tax=Sphingomonas crocodyli TaxID=1979270 RepID=A0A437M668_9SPHN|nr:FAD-binding protein [Sphingomonas crocodyli]RVT93220.1 FAD-binding protein [Sphingomonas crocodyli]
MEEQAFDFVIVGSGAAAIPAAIAIKERGLRPLVIEKTEFFGGSTSMSGGVVWIPNSSVAKAAGVVDDPRSARIYFDACVGDVGPASSEARRDAYLSTGPVLMDKLIAKGMEWVHAEGYSDYHEGQKPEGNPRSRSLVAPIFDLRKLGAWRNKLRRTVFPPMMMHEAGHAGQNGRTLASIAMMLRVGSRMIRNALGADLVGAGSAIQGRLLEIGLREGVPIWLGTVIDRWIVEDGRVTGLEVTIEGVRKRVKATRGVLINAGGFSHNAKLRSAEQRQPNNGSWSHANPGDTGEVIEAAIGLGAATALMEESWWVPASEMPGGALGMHPFDMTKPHCIMVDATAQRFVNESTSYMAIGIAMYERNKVVPAVPAWLIMDRQLMDKWRWSNVNGKPPKEWIDSGYMIEAESIEALATQCGLDPKALRATVDRFNGFADSGVDEDFGRGGSAYDRWQGDYKLKPNPNVGRIEKGPFRAVRIVPGDVGTSGGLMTDENGRVLRADGSAIPGLYATGNSTASVFGHSYPGAGASIGASMIYGYRAALHAAGANDMEGAA